MCRIETILPAGWLRSRQSTTLRMRRGNETTAQRTDPPSNGRRRGSGMPALKNPEESHEPFEVPRWARGDVLETHGLSLVLGIRASPQPRLVHASIRSAVTASIITTLPGREMAYFVIDGFSMRWAGMLSVARVTGPRRTFPSSVPCPYTREAHAVFRRLCGKPSSSCGGTAGHRGLCCVHCVR